MLGVAFGVAWGLGTERPASASLPPDVLSGLERTGQIPEGTRAQIGGVIVSKRDRRTLRPELAVSPGPLALGQPGGGTLRELYGAGWAVGLYRSGPRLYQARSGVWLDRADPDALADLAGARHVSLAFDQAARPVLAWEREGQVYVRQWEPGRQQYSSRGPFAGVDPLLLWDIAVLGEAQDSDVLLYYLSPDRRQLCYRVQHERYDTERVAHVFPAPVCLDQIVPLTACWQLLGADEAGVPFALRSHLYPLNLGPERLRATLSGLRAGLARSVVVAHELAPDGSAGAASGLTGGQIKSVVLTSAPAVEATQASLGSVTSGRIKGAVLTSAPPGDATTASVNGLAGGRSKLVVITYTAPLAGTQASIGGLTGGRYAKG